MDTPRIREGIRKMRFSTILDLVCCDSCWQGAIEARTWSNGNVIPVFTLKQCSAWLALAGLIVLMFAGCAYGEDQPPRYLAFQFFTASAGAQTPFF